MVKLGFWVWWGAAVQRFVSQAARRPLTLCRPDAASSLLLAIGLCPAIGCLYETPRRPSITCKIVQAQEHAGRRQAWQVGCEQRRELWPPPLVSTPNRNPTLLQNRQKPCNSQRIHQEGHEGPQRRPGSREACPDGERRCVPQGKCCLSAFASTAVFRRMSSHSTPFHRLVCPSGCMRVVSGGFFGSSSVMGMLLVRAVTVVVADAETTASQKRRRVRPLRTRRTPPHAAVSLRSATPSSSPVSLAAARRHYSHLLRGNDCSGAYLSRQDVYMHGRRAHLRPGPASGLKNILLAGIRTATLRLHPPYLYIFWASWS